MDVQPNLDEVLTDDEENAISWPQELGGPRLDRATFLKGAVAAGVLVSVPGGLALAAKPKTGGTLRLGTIGTTTESYDPYNAVGLIDVIRTNQVFQALAGTQPNSSSVTAALAESWEPNKSRNQYKVRLKPGVEFHNGKSITADDVLYSYRRFAQGRGAALVALIDLKRTHKIDKHTVLFQLTEPYGLFEQLLTYAPLIPAGQNTFTSSNLVGAGPFKVKQISPGQLTVLTRFAHYWDRPRPYLGGLNIVSFNDPTAQVNAFISGQVDAIDSIDPTQIGQIRSAGLKLLRGVGGTWTPIVMDCTKAPFTDNRVRTAMKLIASRSLMIRNAYGGFGTLGDDYYGAGEPQYPVPGHQIPQTHQDIAQAKHLLKKAGHEHLKVTLQSSEVALGMLASALIFAQEAKKAGITVNVVNNPSDTYYSNQYLKVPFYQSNWGPHPIEQQSAECIEGGYLETKWHSPKYVSLIQQARRTFSDSKRAELYLEAQKLLRAEGGYIIWGFQNSLDAYSPGFTGFSSKVAGREFGNYDFRDVHRT